MQLSLCCPYASNLFKSHSCPAADCLCNRQQIDFRRTSLIPTAFSESRSGFSLPPVIKYLAEATDKFLNSYQQFLELTLVLIKFSQLRTDSAKQSNILLQSDLVTRKCETASTVSSPASLSEFCHLLWLVQDFFFALCSCTIENMSAPDPYFLSITTIQSGSCTHVLHKT